MAYRHRLIGTRRRLDNQNELSPLTLLMLEHALPFPKQFQRFKLICDAQDTFRSPRENIIDLEQPDGHELFGDALLRDGRASA